MSDPPRLAPIEATALIRSLELASMGDSKAIATLGAIGQQRLKWARERDTADQRRPAEEIGSGMHYDRQPIAELAISALLGLRAAGAPGAERAVQRIAKNTRVRTDLRKLAQSGERDPQIGEVLDRTIVKTANDTETLIRLVERYPHDVTLVQRTAGALVGQEAAHAGRLAAAYQRLVRKELKSDASTASVGVTTIGSLLADAIAQGATMAPEQRRPIARAMRDVYRKNASQLSNVLVVGLALASVGDHEATATLKSIANRNVKWARERDETCKLLPASEISGVQHYDREQLSELAHRALGALGDTAR